MEQSWRDMVLNAVNQGCAPGGRISVQSIYQRVKSSPSYQSREEIDKFEETVRNTLNKLVNDGTIQRASRGVYSRLS
jgi:hypothetical protein